MVNKYLYRGRVILFLQFLRKVKIKPFFSMKFIWTLILKYCACIFFHYFEDVSLDISLDRHCLTAYVFYPGPRGFSWQQNRRTFTEKLKSLVVSTLRVKFVFGVRRKKTFGYFFLCH